MNGGKTEIEKCKIAGSFRHFDKTSCPIATWWRERSRPPDNRTDTKAKARAMAVNRDSSVNAEVHIPRSHESSKSASSVYTEINLKGGGDKRTAHAFEPWTTPPLQNARQKNEKKRAG